MKKLSVTERAGLLVARLLAVALIAFGAGYNYGVKHTEEQWSNAVSKGEWDRKYRQQ